MGNNIDETGKLIGQLCSDTAKTSSLSTEVDLKRLKMMGQMLKKMEDKGLGVDDMLDFLSDFKDQSKKDGNLKYMSEVFKLWMQLLKVEGDVGLKSIVTNMTQVNNLKEMGDLILSEPEDEEDFIQSEIKRIQDEGRDIGDVEVTDS